jgi:CHRD domain
MRRRLLCTLSALAGAAIALAAAPAVAETITVQLRGFEEVPANTSAASGSLRLFINDRAGTIDYELTYENLQGNVTQAHIHIAQAGVNGGIAIWLCGTAAFPGPAGTPACPSPGGTVTGVLTASDLVAITPQLVAAGELDEVIAAIRAGKAYGNVHSSVAGGGEIRGQLQ